MKLIKLSVFMASLAVGLLMSTAHAQRGPDTCSQGYVWREAFPGDHVCVTPETRTQAASDNRQAGARREPGGGPYGPATCRQGYVWREARSDDHVCVTPEARAQAASDNHQAANRVARGGSDNGRDERNTAGRTCTIFEHRNYGGAHWTLHNGDDMQMIDQPDVGTSNGIYRLIYKSSWNDKVSSFKVGPTCTLTLWEHVNRGGHHFTANKNYSYVGDGWNDKASEAICECAGLPNL